MSVEMPAIANSGQSITPVSKSKINIEPRRVGFEYGDMQSPFFYKGNPCISAMWVVLSTSFPMGEAEFIKSTRNFERQIKDPKLLEDVKHFAQQEAHHSLQHRQINKLFEDMGYACDHLESMFKKKLAEREATWSHERRLARTVVAEHVTAVMAHYALTQEEEMAGFPESIRSLFQWHAIEEIEHKSVTFDVYQHCVGDRKLLMKEYYQFLYYEFPMEIGLAGRYLLKQKGHKVTWKERWAFYKYIFGKNGLVGSMKSEYWAFRKPGFHPWDYDDSHLVEEWKQKLSPYFKA